MLGKRIIVVLLTLMSLMACNINKTKDDEAAAKPEKAMTSWVLPAHVERWLEDQEYGLVLDWLDTLPHDEPGFEAVKQIHNEVRELAKNYEKNILKEVDREIAKDNLDGVFLLLSTALRKLPNSKILKQKRNKLFRKQVRQISYINRQLLIARGEYVLKEAQLREQLAQLDWDNPTAQWNQKRIKEEEVSTSNDLLDCAISAMREGFLEQARKCLQISGKLNRSERYIKVSRQMQQRAWVRQQREAKEKARQVEKDRKATAAELEDLAKKALYQGSLRAALDIIEELVTIDPSNTQAKQLKKAVEHKLSSRVAALMKRGNNYYKQGSIEEAKRDWEEVLRLDPGNKEAKVNIQRAQRVLKNLNELQGEES